MFISKRIQYEAVLIPEYLISCCSIEAMFSEGALSLPLHLVTDIFQRLWDLSSSTIEPDQSSVSPLSDDDGMGCGGTETLVEGLKSISEVLFLEWLRESRFGGWGGRESRWPRDPAEKAESTSELNPTSFSVECEDGF
jgi:hypothetical protein